MKRILVTGGGGFVGKSIVQMAVAQGAECTVLGRNFYPEVERLGAHCLVGDICNERIVHQACRGVDTVFHVAALAGIWGPWQKYYQVNVIGTRNVIAGCRENDVARLVYTSTPSVVFDRQDIAQGDESLPYATRFLCHYAKSKVMAEKDVLAANSAALSTCALRPHLIWGPGDPHLIPRLLAKGKAGQLKQVGNGGNLVDISYVDNVAHAHILAAKNLATSKSAAGKAYFISQHEPVNLWGWINELYEQVGIPPITQKVPFGVAYAAGALLESAYTLLKRDQEPPMTRFLAEQLAKSHWFSIARAEADLGYQPIVSTQDGMRHLVNWIRQNEKHIL